MIFDKLSPTTDFISKIQLELHLINKNVLYCTHELDKIKKIVIRLEVDHNLQKQVDDYLGPPSAQGIISEDITEDIPEEQ